MFLDALLWNRKAVVPGYSHGMLKTQKFSNSQSGQIGVVILLIMVVLLTVGLSIATRTTQETFLSTQSSESARVFNAAEAGIEEALSTDLSIVNQSSTPITGTLNPSDIDDTSVDYSITKVNSLETQLFQGITVQVNVTGVTNGQGIVVEWSKGDCASNPASFIAAIYYNDAGTIRSRYRTLGNCAKGDGFEQATTLAAGNAYRFRFTLPLQTNDLFVRLQPIYNDTHIRVAASGWTLPTQFYKIRSEARNELGNETRIVEVNRTLPTAPSVMDYALYSGATIVQ